MAPHKYLGARTPQRGKKNCTFLLLRRVCKSNMYDDVLVGRQKIHFLPLSSKNICRRALKVMLPTQLSLNGRKFQWFAAIPISIARESSPPEPEPNLTSNFLDGQQWTELNRTNPTNPPTDVRVRRRALTFMYPSGQQNIAALHYGWETTSG